jgi:hypothetical protein
VTQTRLARPKKKSRFLRERNRKYRPLRNKQREQVISPSTRKECELKYKKKYTRSEAGEIVDDLNIAIIPNKRQNKFLVPFTLQKLFSCKGENDIVKGPEVLSHANIFQLVSLKALSFTLLMTGNPPVLRNMDALVTSNFFVFCGSARSSTSAPYFHMVPIVFVLTELVRF